MDACQRYDFTQAFRCQWANKNFRRRMDVQRGSQASSLWYSRYTHSRGEGERQIFLADGPLSSKCPEISVGSALCYGHSSARSEDLEAPTLPSAHDIREVDFASLHSSRPHIDDDHMLCQHVLGLPPPWLEIQRGTMPTDDDDFADELPSPTAVRAAYSKSPMVVGMLGMRNSLIPALHSLEPWQRLDPCSLNISCPWPCTLRGHRSI